MAEVLVKVKLFPESAETDLSELVERLGSIGFRLNATREEPIAFGLKALVAEFVVQDAEGEAEKLEERLREMSGVGELEVMEVHRLL
ncbi:MAG: elongation factor 1-beta [Euryarchaeota archaeon]|nr:elongation factor 1-beta [Euryarchaeota archaeon]